MIFKTYIYYIFFKWNRQLSNTCRMKKTLMSLCYQYILWIILCMFHEALTSVIWKKLQRKYYSYIETLSIHIICIHFIYLLSSRILYYVLSFTEHIYNAYTLIMGVSLCRSTEKCVKKWHTLHGDFLSFIFFFTEWWTWCVLIYILYAFLVCH